MDLIQAMQEEVLEEFGLTNNQMRSDVNGLPFAKNQWWFLDKVSLNEVTKYDPYRVVYYEIVAKINSPAPCRIKIANRQDAVDLFVKLLMSSEGL